MLLQHGIQLHSQFLAGSGEHRRIGLVLVQSTQLLDQVVQLFEELEFLGMQRLSFKTYRIAK